MRKLSIARLGFAGFVSIVVTACPASTPGSDDDTQAAQPDAGGMGSGSGSGMGSGSASGADACPLATTLGDLGSQMAWKANRCNVPGSGGTKKWYRLSAAVPGSAGDYIQLDLWPNLGAYPGAVTTGEHAIAGNDTDYVNCGVCGRAVGDKGAATVKEYFAHGGTVNVTSITTTLSATLTNLSLVEVNLTSQQPIANGCAAMLTNIAISGTIVDVGGTGGGGGGGGGGGSCPERVGD
jgi:hypothetical protein